MNNLLDLRKIDVLLKQKGLTRSDLAQGSGVPLSTINLLIRTNSTRPATLEKIASFLEVETTDFLKVGNNNNWSSEPQKKIPTISRVSISSEPEEYSYQACPPERQKEKERSCKTDKELAEIRQRIIDYRNKEIDNLFKDLTEKDRKLEDLEKVISDKNEIIKNLNEKMIELQDKYLQLLRENTKLYEDRRFGNQQV